MSRTESAKHPASVIGRAVRRIHKYGIDGPRPMEEIERLHDLGDEVLPALRKALATAPPDLLASTLHLVRLLRPPDFGEHIAAAALRRPASLEAKVEAVETLEESGVEVPATVVETMTVARDFAARPTADALARVLDLPEAWRIAALEAWLGGEPGQDPGLLERALGVNGELDRQVVSCLGDSGQEAAVPILQRIVEEGDRELRKDAKRALHRLRNLGVDATEPASEAGFTMAIRPDVRRESRAYVTGIDGGGGRVLWVLAPSPAGGERLLEAVFDDSRGLHRADVLTVTRKGFRQHIRKLTENPGILVVQVDPSEGVVLLREAEGRVRERGGEVPEAYLRWSDDVASELVDGDSPIDGDESPGGELPAGDAVTEGAADSLRESVELLGDPVFANWAFTGPEAERGAASVRQAELSTLVVDEEQRKQQVDRAIAAVGDAFDSDLRARYRRRLEDMANLLARLKRDRESGLARAAAVGFTDVADLYAGHPFARALIQRGVMVAYQQLREEEERDAGDSRIVTP